MPPRFSVIVPTRNRRTALAECLANLGAQTFPRDQFEVIVVDDGSDDGSEAEAVGSLTDAERPASVRVVRIEHQGPGAARNAGAALATGEYLAFTEDDVVVAPDWIERADTCLRRDPIDVLEGRTLLRGTVRSTRRGESKPVPSFIPCNLFIRRDVFRELGGYSPQFFDLRSGLYFREDADLGFRALEHGFTHAIDPSVLVEHPEQFNSIAACVRHAQRYMFDPLLYCRHHALFRRYIEVKSFGRLRLHRPLHLVSLLSVLGFVLIASGVATADMTMLVGGALVVLIAGFAVRVKYQGRRALHLWNLIQLAVFTALPIIYLGALVRGCRYARGGFGVLI